MQNDTRIHLVGCREYQSATDSELSRNIGDIVRETLTIARDCDEELARSNLKKDPLLIELIASLVVVRLRKAGGR
jgi:hypothetical protein